MPKKRKTKTQSQESPQTLTTRKIHLWDHLSSKEGKVENMLEQLEGLLQESPRMAVLNIIDLLFHSLGVPQFSEPLYEEEDFVASQLSDKLQEIRNILSKKDFPLMKTSSNRKTRLFSFLERLFPEGGEHLEPLLQQIPLLLEVLRIFTSTKVRLFRPLVTQIACHVGEVMLGRIKKLINSGEHLACLRLYLRHTHSFYLEYLLKDRINDVDRIIRRKITHSINNTLFYAKKNFAYLEMAAAIFKKKRDSDFKKESPSLRNCNWIKELVEILKGRLLDSDQTVVEIAIVSLENLSTGFLPELIHFESELQLSGQITTLRESINELKGQLFTMNTDHPKCMLAVYSCLKAWSSSPETGSLFTDSEKARVYCYVNCDDFEVRRAVANDIMTIVESEEESQWVNTLVLILKESVFSFRNSYFREDPNSAFQENHLEAVWVSFLSISQRLSSPQAILDKFFGMKDEPKPEDGDFTEMFSTGTVLLYMLSCTLKVFKKALQEQELSKDEKTLSLKLVSNKYLTDDVLKDYQTKVEEAFQDQRFEMMIKSGKAIKGDYLSGVTCLLREIPKLAMNNPEMLVELFDACQEHCQQQNIAQLLVGLDDPMMETRMTLKTIDLLSVFLREVDNILEEMDNGKDITELHSKRVRVEGLSQRLAVLMAEFSCVKASDPDTDQSRQFKPLFNLLTHLGVGNIPSTVLFGYVNTIIVNYACNLMMKALQDPSYLFSFTSFRNEVLVRYKGLSGDDSFMGLSGGKGRQFRTEALVIYLDVVTDSGQDILRQMNSPIYSTVERADIEWAISRMHSLIFKGDQQEMSMLLGNSRINESIMSNQQGKIDPKNGSPKNKKGNKKNKKIEEQILELRSNSSLYNERTASLFNQFLRLALLSFSDCGSIIFLELFQRYLRLKEPVPEIEKVLVDNFLGEAFELEEMDHNQKRLFGWKIGLEAVQTLDEPQCLLISRILIRVFRRKFSKRPKQVSKYYAFCNFVMNLSLADASFAKKSLYFLDPKLFGVNNLKKYLSLAQDKIDGMTLSKENEEQYTLLQAMRNTLARKCNLKLAKEPEGSSKKGSKNSKPGMELEGDQEEQESSKKSKVEQTPLKKSARNKRQKRTINGPAGNSKKIKKIKNDKSHENEQQSQQRL